MNKLARTFVFILFAAFISSTTSFAAFDVSVRFNGGSDVVFIGEDNVMDIYFTNDFPVEGMSLGLKFSNSAGSFELVTPYGSRPNASANHYIMEHGDAVGKFAGGGYLLANLSALPDSILFGGANIGSDATTPLPVHSAPTLCYSMKIRIPTGLTPTVGGFCVDNIFFPPAGHWNFAYFSAPNEVSEASPTFQGQPNSSLVDPDAPAVCFDLVQRPPCDPPQITNCPATSIKAPSLTTASWDFDYTPADGDPVSWSVQALDPVVNAPTIDAAGNFIFTLAGSEAGTMKSFRIIAENACGVDTCDLTVEQIGIQPFVLRIEKTHNTLQGNYEYVSITKEAGSHQMGGFDFLVAYDATALQFTSAQLGIDVGPAGCGWEYFTYRYGAQGNCGGPCPSGLLRVVAIADANNGANHPACFSVPNGGELVRLKFYVTNDRNMECQYVPVRFVWIDCGDNGLSNARGDTLWISARVFEFENSDPLTDPAFEITDSSCYFAVSYGGACNACDVSSKYEPQRFILFWNGGIDIVCADSIDAPGDLNLNGIGYEIADAVLYTNYFLRGLSALDPNPQTREAQIAASDANNDGNTLTVGDLVYLLRVIVGDALPYAKLSPFAGNAAIAFDQGMLSIESSVDVGAVFATFKVNGDYLVNSNTDMAMLSSERDGLLKVLIYSGLENMSRKISAGHNDILTFSGDLELLSAEIADYNGNMLTATLDKSVLPSEFKLSQNTPNPFNPVTRIGLDLPVATDWTLDIYNVSGQLVTSYSGRNQGHTDIEWNAADQPSGVYFYQVRTGVWTESKKMLLLK